MMASERSDFALLGHTIHITVASSCKPFGVKIAFGWTNEHHAALNGDSMASAHASGFQLCHSDTPCLGLTMLHMCLF